ncbi:MAG: hypothetical protein GY768_01135 [Planctomycetaceae bacterium]|nr:hypothetical protein [Planctomycetaceae bacterium]
MALPRYDVSKTYQWNYDHPPDPLLTTELKKWPLSGETRLCGLKLNSPLGIAAGPLLNGRWILYYASLGFDILTYKTVRSCERSCYPLPNLVPVDSSSMSGAEQRIQDQQLMQDSWAISFGMPSQSPQLWREDVRLTREQLAAKQLLAVSVVATVEPDWSIQQVADDYARCAHWAVEAGADLIEINLSCPNVSTCDGQLYQQPKDAAVVSATVKRTIGSIPLLAKIGFVGNDLAATELLSSVAPHLDALIMVNGLATQIIGPDGQARFDGQVRGIGGGAIREVSQNQLSRFESLIRQHQFDIELVGCGGVSSARDVQDMMACGAKSVQLATAAMLNPAIANEIRRELIAESDATDGTTDGTTS